MNPTVYGRMSGNLRIACWLIPGWEQRAGSRESGGVVSEDWWCVSVALDNAPGPLNALARVCLFPAGLPANNDSSPLLVWRK